MIPGEWDPEDNQETKETRQGERTDLKRVAQALLQGASRNQIARRFPGEAIRYHKGLEAYKDSITPKPPGRRADKRVIVLIGEPGTGKTRFAQAFAWTYFRQRPYLVRARKL